MEALAWIEQTALSTWTREEPFVFPLVLAIHSLGMGLSVGVAIAMSLRILGFAPGIALSLLRQLKPLVWIGLIANTFSGLVLLLAYPAKALTNPVFYIKLLLLAAALWLMVRLLRLISNDALPPNAKHFAVLAMVCWIGVIAGGRFLAYTNTVMLASWLV
jgi:hypothetical protein